MILTETILYAADNSGAQIVKCIKILNGFRRRYAKLGNIIVVCLKKLYSFEKIDKKTLYYGLIIGSTKKTRRKDGSFIRFDANFVLILNDQSKFLGSRIYGPICKEIRSTNDASKYNQIISYAKATV